MTEDQIERRVETQTNALDRALMSDRLTQAAYDDLMAELDAWAERELKRRVRH